jgi:hypothetical protein
VDEFGKPKIEWSLVTDEALLDDYTYFPRESALTRALAPVLAAMDLPGGYRSAIEIAWGLRHAPYRGRFLSSLPWHPAFQRAQRAMSERNIRIAAGLRWWADQLEAGGGSPELVGAVLRTMMEHVPWPEVLRLHAGEAEWHAEQYLLAADEAEAAPPPVRRPLFCMDCLSREANHAVDAYRPSVVGRDELGRLHRTDGPAVAYRDGYGLWAIHGQEPFLRAAGAGLVDEDLDALGFPRRLHRVVIPGDEDLVMVEVTNSTPEPDGHHKSYMLRVDPRMRTCAGAIASSWRYPDGSRVFAEGRDYQLAAES